MNMTGDPNQINRPTVFGFNTAYPSTANWSECQQGNAYRGYEQQTPFTQFTHQPSSMPTTNYSFYSNFGTVPSPISFPFSPVQNEHHLPVHIPLRCKRKTDSPPPIIAKQHITEERMAEHLSKLHISSENPAPSVEPETNDLREKRLYMCEEMRKLQNESIIPASLLERYQRPCTALVLWTPPQRPLPREEDSPNNNNNEEEVPDNNLMEFDR